MLSLARRAHTPSSYSHRELFGRGSWRRSLLARLAWQAASAANWSAHSWAGPPPTHLQRRLRPPAPIRAQVQVTWSELALHNVVATGTGTASARQFCRLSRLGRRFSLVLVRNSVVKYFVCKPPERASKLIDRVVMAAPRRRNSLTIAQIIPFNSFVCAPTRVCMPTFGAKSASCLPQSSGQQELEQDDKKRLRATAVRRVTLFVA